MELKQRPYNVCKPAQNVHELTNKPILRKTDAKRGGQTVRLKDRQTDKIYN